MIMSHAVSIPTLGVAHGSVGASRRQINAMKTLRSEL